MRNHIFLFTVLFLVFIFFLNSDTFVNAIEYTDDSDYLPSWAVPLEDDLAIDECFEIIENSLLDSEWCADWLNYLLLKEAKYIKENKKILAYYKKRKTIDPNLVLDIKLNITNYQKFLINKRMFFLSASRSRAYIFALLSNLRFFINADSLSL